MGEKMSHSFLSPLPIFTLESLVTNGQWNAVQTNDRKKSSSARSDMDKSKQNAARTEKTAKPE